jgi:hypothetical protein
MPLPWPPVFFESCSRAGHPGAHFILALSSIFIPFSCFGEKKKRAFIAKGEANNHRKVLGEYSGFLDQMVSIVTEGPFFLLSLHIVPGDNCEFQTRSLAYHSSCPFGVFRYLYLTYQRNEGGPNKYY